MKKMQNTSKWNALECALLAMLACTVLGIRPVGAKKVEL